MNLNINLGNIGDYYSSSSEEEEEEGYETDYSIGVKEINYREGIPGVRLPNIVKKPIEPTNPAPYGYLSIQDRINSRNGKIDPKQFNLHLREMVNQGWMELTDINEAERYIIPGMRIRYITKDKHFRTGGWVVLFKEEDDDKGIVKKYIVYKAHNNVTFSLQYEDIDRLFFIHGNKKRKDKKEVDKKVDEEGIKIMQPRYKKPIYDSDYPVYLNDKNGNKVGIYYADSKYKRKRFMESEKFKSAQKYGWSFHE